MELPWNFTKLLERHQGWNVDILQVDVPRVQDNRSINNRSTSVPYKERIADVTGELQTYHSPQRRLQASCSYSDESYATKSVDSEAPRSVLWGAKGNHARHDSGYPSLVSIRKI